MGHSLSMKMAFSLGLRRLTTRKDLMNYFSCDTDDNWGDSRNGFALPRWVSFRSVNLCLQAAGCYNIFQIKVKNKLRANLILNLNHLYMTILNNMRSTFQKRTTRNLTMVQNLFIIIGKTCTSFWRFFVRLKLKQHSTDSSRLRVFLYRGYTLDDTHWSLAEERLGLGWFIGLDSNVEPPFITKGVKLFLFQDRLRRWWLFWHSLLAWWT